jgi:hypothetical protein
MDPKFLVNLQRKEASFTLGGKVYRRRARDPEREWPFWDRVDKTETCWLWKGKKIKGGYGQLTRAGRFVYAHRYAYEMAHGPIPEGRQVDHLCRNRLCVNPAHLEVVSQQENIRRGHAGKATGARSRARTHCGKGHPFDERNTRWYKGERCCRECARLHARANYWKRKENEPPGLHGQARRS